MLELALMLLGMIFVRREVWEFHATTLIISHWQAGVMVPLAALDGGITGAYSSRTRNVEHLPSYKKLMGVGIATFYFLYVACAALCERLNVGVFTMGGDYFRTLGFLIVLAGMGLRLWAHTSPPSALIQEADAAALRIGTSGADAKTSELKLTETQTGSGSATADVAGAGEDAADVGTGSGAETAADVGTAADAGTPAEIGTAADAGPPAEIGTAADVGTPESPSSDTDDATPTDTFVSTVAPAQEQHFFLVGPHRLVRYPDALGKLISLVGLSLAFNAWMPLFILPGVFILLKWHIGDREAFRISQLGQPYLEYRKNTWNLLPHIY